MKLARTIALLALVSVPAQLPAEEEGWISLFDGKSLDQWTLDNGKPVTKGWKVEDGTIYRFEKAGSINTKETYENFIREFEWKISKKGNSGVKYRFKKGLGLEYQVLDDSGHRDERHGCEGRGQPVSTQDQNEGHDGQNDCDEIGERWADCEHDPNEDQARQPRPLLPRLVETCHDEDQPRQSCVVDPLIPGWHRAVKQE